MQKKIIIFNFYIRELKFTNLDIFIKIYFNQVFFFHFFLTIILLIILYRPYIDYINRLYILLKLKFCY